VEFLEKFAPKESATILACRILREKAEPGETNLLLNLPKDVFNYILVPFLKAPPFDAIQLPGLSSFEISAFMSERLQSYKQKM
jgi:hypothetical protein